MDKKKRDWNGRKPVDISGQRFGKLIALERVGTYSNGVSIWKCKCDCGNEKNIPLSHLRRTTNNTKSCGCLKRIATEHLGSQQKVNFIRSGLRRLWLKWPPRYHTIIAARVDRGKYLCVGYGVEEHIIKRKEINVDHIIPVGSIENWDSHINNLFCSANNLQALCLGCHKRKTADERKKT